MKGCNSPYNPHEGGFVAPFFVGSRPRIGPCQRSQWLGPTARSQQGTGGVYVAWGTDGHDANGHGDGDETRPLQKPKGWEEKSTSRLRF